MDAYEKMFIEVYDSLYPPGDVSKSKAAREKNEKNGNYYFKDEEAPAVMKLRAAGKFLTQLIDTKFEGEDNE